MKQLTARTRALFERLESTLVSGNTPSGQILDAKVKDAAALLVEIANRHEWPALIFLAPYVFCRDVNLRRTAADVVEQLLRDIRPTHLLQVDEALRSSLYALGIPIVFLQNITAENAEYWFQSENKTALAVRALASFNRSGYLRERAVVRLGMGSDGRELPFLLIRISDWVPSILNIAAAEIERRLTTEYAPHFLDNLALLYRVVQRERRTGLEVRRALVTKVEQFLKSKAHRGLLIGGLEHSDVEVRRASLTLLSEIREVKTKEITSRLLKDSDVVTRRLAFKFADNLSAPERLLLLKQLACDSAGVIRRDAVRALCLESDTAAREYGRAALLDSSSAVREYGRWQLGQLDPQFDFRDFYLQNLQDALPETNLASAIYGVAETGKAEDAAVLFPLVEQGAPSQRRAVISAVAKLDGEHYAEQLLLFLPNSNNSLSAAACKALVPLAHHIAPENLWTLVVSTEGITRRRILKVLNAVEKWERLIYMLQAFNLDGDGTRDLAVLCISNWLRQYGMTWIYTSPSAEQKSRLSDAIASYEASSGPSRGALCEIKKMCAPLVD